jgi:hypothetical protein
MRKQTGAETEAGMNRKSSALAKERVHDNLIEEEQK